MKIYVVGNSKNRFLPLNNIREKFLIDKKHDGDNIDSLNPWYCELTGLYYLWKNVNDDIVGLEHYRRYFVNKKNQILSENEIKSMLSKSDIICIKASNYSKTKPVITWINQNKKRLDFDKFLIFCKYYVGKDYYNECWKILRGDYHILGNMFICKKELIDEYCKFIFDVLFMYQEAEKSFGRKLPGRIMGYFTEFLFAAWIKMNNKTVWWAQWKKTR